MNLRGIALVSLTSSVFLVSAAFAWPSPGSVAEAPVDSLLEWHAEAMGFDRDAPSDSCLHMVSRLTVMGVEGTATSWNQAPLRSRSEMALGPLSMTTTFDGESGWMLDRNGAVREAEGPELDSLLHEALLGDGSYLLRHPPVPLRWQKLPAALDGEVSLQFTPLLGSPLRIDLDATSLRPKRLTSNSPQGEQVSEILSWGEFAGRPIVRSSRMRIAGQIEIDIELLEIALLSPRPEEFFQPGGTTAPPPDVLFADGVDAVDLRLLDDGLHLLVEGLLDDETPLVFLVDTGAGGNIIDRGAAERLGLPLQGRIKTLGVGGAEEASFVDIATVEFGGVKVVDQSWLTADFSALGRLFGIRPAAVLGYDLLSRVVLDVDYPQRRVVVRRPGTFAPPAGATSVPIRMDSNVPSIEVEIEGVKTWVHVDTGSDSGLDLGSPFVDEHDLLEGREIEGEAALLGVGGSTTSQRGRIATLRIGDLLLQDVPAGFHRAEGGIFANASIGGILGAGVLSQFRCVLDYPDRTFHLIRVEER